MQARSINSRFYTLLLLLHVAVASQYAQASSYLKKNSLFCDTTKILCIKGTLSVHPNDGIAILRGRVHKKTVPGFIRMTLHGYKEKNISVAYIQGRIDGKYSKIIDLKNGISVHNDTRWVLHRFEYLTSP